MNEPTKPQPHWISVDFATAKIETDPTTKVRTLVVKGDTPSASSDGNTVKLEPVHYVVQPDFWRVQVMWDDTNSLFQTLTPYEAKLDLKGASGKKGVEVVGESRSEKISF